MSIFITSVRFRQIKVSDVTILVASGGRGISVAAATSPVVDGGESAVATREGAVPAASDRVEVGCLRCACAQMAAAG